MKLKGISAFEQHVEKIVLGVLGVSALGVVASQFIFQSNQITVGQATVSPDKAYDPVAEKAEWLRSQVAAKNPELPQRPKTDVLDRFQKRLAGPVAPRQRLTDLGPAVVLGDSGGGGGTVGPVGDAQYAKAEVPPTSVPVAHFFGGTVDPLEVIGAPEIKTVLPPEQPFDLFGVSVETTFNGEELEKSLQTDPDGDGGPIRPIPLGWVQNVQIIGVQLERERLTDTGEWTATAQSGAIPGRFDLAGEIAAKVKSAGDMPAMIEAAAQRAAEVQRPDFYTLIAGTPWQPPTEAQDGQSPAELIDAKQKKINSLDAELERLKKRQQAATDPKLQDPRSPDRGGGRGMPGAGGRGQPGGETREARPTRPQPEAGKPPKEDALTRQINRRQEERERLDAEIKALQEKMVNPGGAVRNDPLLPLLKNPKVRLWAHDVKVEPGAVYRYRTRVAINNPFFGKDGSLAPTQKALAKEALAYGEWSEWTDPVTVMRKQYYYITSAAERDAVGGDRATADLLEFYYGFFRLARMNAQPGDLLVADAKLPSELRIFDMQRLAAGERPKPEEPGREVVGPGGRHSDPRDRGIATPEDLGEQPPKSPEGDLAKPAPLKLAMTFDAVLLDVAPLPGGGSKSGGTKAFLREGQGHIVTRVPEQTTSDPVYLRLMQSAKLGESQGKPTVMAREPRIDTAPPDRLPQRGKTAPPPGGGGEGGGGGGG